jgi:hypothetical protein
LNWTTIVSLHILSNSVSTTLAAIWHCIVGSWKYL